MNTRIPTSSGMKHIILELRSLIDEFAIKINAMPVQELEAKPHPHKWSKKEVLGHLVDSAQNNIRRFIVGQYEETPSKITYDQDFWVTSNNYQHMRMEDLITLWKLANERIAAVLEQMPEKNYSKQSLTSELHTLQWLAEDYVKHMKHHLNQIISGSFDVVYK